MDQTLAEKKKKQWEKKEQKWLHKNNNLVICKNGTGLARDRLMRPHYAELQ
jgi:molybdopterin biosynthesis enzyme MoaB